MLKSVRSLLATTAVASAAFVAFAATPALAQEESESDLTVSGNVAIVTDYRFRGVSLSDGKAAVQGGIDLAHSSGFYVGTWASSLEDSPLYGSMELDIYGGWSGEVTSGLNLDVGLLYYAYPTKDDGVGPSDIFEPYVKLSTTVGPVGATLGVAYAWDQDSLGDEDNLYLFADLEVGIPSTPITLSGHIGYTDGPLAPEYLLGGTDKTAIDWSIGASATILGGLSLGVSYIGSQGPNVDDYTDNAVVGTLSYSF
ncbi:TorF family putative porin [Tsuneonella sp. CC-YZS046]|uniref:TorF family putative porin n=1 Tax=Tsuneonella sp. CC-YZS046 TaxID=3042152 RepID=UPI002D77C723|nr:TorF family putative porin [Tsuneonella sp. CC-YZS046]WRO66865.1 TorF family putative porin [Tsuneonella sp. CC-YZS046]